MIVFDLETDGLLDSITKIHSLVLKNTQSGEVISCADQEGFIPIKRGLELLADADAICGHNIIKFDIPAIKKVFPSWNHRGKVRDTLVISRLIYTNMMELDATRTMRIKKEYWGKHSLESWGIRLGFYKSEYNDWSRWTKEMQRYCEVDVEVTARLLKHLEEKEYSEQAIELEHQFAQIMFEQETNGVPFDEAKAEELYCELHAASERLEKQIRSKIPNQIKEEVFTPKRNNKTMGYIKDVPYTKKKEIIFNPGSRQQIVQYLQDAYGWIPDKLTEAGNASLDEEVLDDLPWEEIKWCGEYLKTKALMGKIKTAKGAWLNYVKNGKIHGSVNTNGAVTGRCTHSKPNMSQVPSPKKFKGEECRSLFHAPPGMVMVGCDASGLELRMLAHYLGAYDDGRYSRIVCDGDVHTENQRAAGISTRDDAKRFIYAFCYGAGDAKLGSIIEPTESKDYRARIGNQIRTSFLQKIQGLDTLIQGVKSASKRGHLIGLDGRLLHIRSEYKALNTLLQSAGGVVMKKATCLMWEKFREQGLFVQQLLNVHDENAVACYLDKAEEVAEIMEQAIVDAGEYFNLRCPLAGESAIGNTWYDIH